jgi:hypothetical protein
MNKFMYNLMLLFLGLLLIFVIFLDYEWLSLVTFKSENKSYEEAFIPRIVKETYRPLERNVKRNFEGFYDKSSTDISNLFRKFGIL